MDAYRYLFILPEINIMIDLEAVLVGITVEVPILLHMVMKALVMFTQEIDTLLLQADFMIGGEMGKIIEEIGILIPQTHNYFCITYFVYCCFIFYILRSCTLIVFS